MNEIMVAAVTPGLSVMFSRPSAQPEASSLDAQRSPQWSASCSMYGIWSASCAAHNRSSHASRVLVSAGALATISTSSAMMA